MPFEGHRFRITERLGIRLMARKASLPKLNQCSSPAPQRVSLTECRVIEALFAFFVIAVLGLAHIQLKFYICDLKMQHGRLQEQRGKLDQELAFMGTTNETLCDSDRLRTIGLHELSLEQCDPKTQVVAVVPDTLRQKYESRSLPANANRAGMDLAVAGGRGQGGDSIQQFFLSLADMNKAYAGGKEQ